MAPEHSPVAATVRDGAGQCPLCGVEQTLSERIATSQFDPSPTSGRIVRKAGFASFLTRLGRKVLGFKHQDVRS
jgi:hypothetical protein